MISGACIICEFVSHARRRARPQTGDSVALVDFGDIGGALLPDLSIRHLFPIPAEIYGGHPLSSSNPLPTIAIHPSSRQRELPSFFVISACGSESSSRRSAPRTI